ncbi:cyclic nucleotide-binding domain-containing protein [Tropicimonas aquimaris]|uniref:Cyclic nucleotide-binding domain-containing protein n=1 Tax=Tropicimonas aquimaris TaxID=914152 RepID=A0ABW3IUR1_9RHOB
MTRIEIEALLADHPDFHQFTAAERARLATWAREERYPAGTTIFNEEDPADTVFLLLEGDVAVQNALPGGPPVIIETLHPGDMLGWAWLVPPFRRMSDAIAQTDVRAVGLDAAGVRALCNAHPEMGYRLFQNWLPHLVQRFRSQRLQILDVYSERPR